MKVYAKSTAIALVLGASLGLSHTAMAQNQAGQTAGQSANQARGQMAHNECWARFAEFDKNQDKVIDANELGTDKQRIFGMLDRNSDDAIARDEYLNCLAVQGGDRAALDESFGTFDENSDQRIDMAEFVEGDAMERTKVQVQQQTPRVIVQQGEPTVNVAQAQPQVKVDQPQPTVSVEQAQPTVDVQQQQPKVTVQQPEPKVTVQQPEPKVTVQQAKPEVEVQQAKPQVEVQQAQPKVAVEQAEPKVAVEQAEPKVEVQQAEPKVHVEQSDQAQVNVEQQDRQSAGQDMSATEQRTNEGAQRQDEATRTAAAGTGARTSGDGTPIDLTNMNVDEIMGRDVVNRRGEDLGDIEDVVLAPEGDAAHAVISVGGFLGLGAKNVAVPFSELRMGEDNMILMSETTQDGLKGMPAYEKDQYRPYER